MELEKIGRTVGRGATLGFSFKASMTPVIVAMFYCNCCICVVAMRKGIYGNDGESIDGGSVVVMEWEEEGGCEKRRKERALGLVGSEASLDDWLAGQCGVLDFAWLNQGFLRQNKLRILASDFNVTCKMSPSS